MCVCVCESLIKPDNPCKAIYGAADQDRETKTFDEQFSKQNLTFDFSDMFHYFHCWMVLSGPLKKYLSIKKTLFNSEDKKELLSMHSLPKSFSSRVLMGLYLRLYHVCNDCKKASKYHSASSLTSFPTYYRPVEHSLTIRSSGLRRIKKKRKANKPSGM